MSCGETAEPRIRCARGVSFAPFAFRNLLPQILSVLPIEPSLKGRKEAAAAARDLLKVDVGRVRKAGAAQSRKDVVARKGPGRARVPPVLELSSGWAARVPEQRSSGYGAVAATPTKSFTDSSFFFNGSAGDFFGKPGQIPQSWNPQSLDPATGTNATPPGGFQNFIQPNMSQNFIFGGEASQFATFKPSRTMQDVQSEEEMSTPISAKDNNTYVNVDSGEEAPRTEKRIFWTQEEDVRMHKKKEGSYNEKEGEAEAHIDVDELDDQPRPMGQKLAKKLKYAKSKEVGHIDLDELEKFGKIQDEQNANRLKVLEVQQKLSSEKIERTKLAHLVAKEHEEAAEMQREATKYELETRMFETYNRLLSTDLSLMSDEEKLDHANTMKCLKNKLVAEN
ncbi:hypothetical protein C2845_PM07G36640 [Panicum miliaceum]|uniref:No apical meristem-associated C-terminal domain-containing protein n=1 Tax=Panicum miliaceum TaxID=4540 RepID=A0A3L6SLA7_PANMI|nr:hypothetical protein C2845_PM07G36640 [Panicum miliaceum]